MATIAAARLIHIDKPFTSVYTFGQPRALERATARLFNVECKDRFFRFHNNQDIIPRIPARIMGYSHAGTYFYIDDEGAIHQNVGRWFRFVDYVDGAYNTFLDMLNNKQGAGSFFEGIEDHDIKKYVQAIRKYKLGK